MNASDTRPPKHGWIALSPAAVFLCVYLSVSLLTGDFYKMPVAVAFLIAAVYSILIARGIPLEERIARFSQGASQRNILLMIWIFVLSGAFARSAEAMGAVEATVDLTMRLLPGGWLLPGLFLATCLVSLSVGTSVGTIVALTPVAVGLADKTGLETPFMAAVVVGGAFFGDNLSFISDTTIASTRIMGCDMRDKFRVNALIVTPAALLVAAAYLLVDLPADAAMPPTEVRWPGIVPYAVVLALALAGVHVTVVLTAGIAVTGLTGWMTGMQDGPGWLAATGEGIAGMGELIVVTLLSGGILEMIRRGGGIDWLVGKMTRRLSGKRSAELSIAALVSAANLCTANNTVAILTVGPIARDIAARFGLDPRKSASLLDTFSCLVQGLIPYGAQLMMAAGLAGVSPLEIVRYLYYPMAMGGFALAAVLLRYPRKYS